ncbi:MAG: hypothetical protein JXA99_07190 [Candidatus Lokiarchaeota archaeon]|nr:hypothetical protein [Candidatus Lokiarchaeota archaeon]
MEFSEYISDFRGIYWKYYLILERDVKNVEPYISFHKGNENCFSNEFIKLYQAICSEIDVFCKRYCEYIHYKNMKAKLNIEGYLEIKKDRPNISDYAKYINEYQEKLIEEREELAKKQDRKITKKEKDELKLTTQEVFLLESNFKFTPWENWTNENSPEWWKKYNDIKHNRAEKDNYKQANLFNVLSSLAGLCVLEKYFYKDLINEITPLGKTPYFLLQPESNLFCIFDFEDQPLYSIYPY